MYFYCKIDVKKLESSLLRSTFILFLCISYGKRIGALTELALDCIDLHENCRRWVLHDSDQCVLTDFIKTMCLRSCGLCMTVPERYNTKNLPNKLKSLYWLVGIWRSNAGGKAIFPTIPNFTYGEQIEISIADFGPETSTPSLNYTAFAWEMSPKQEELHSENGFITINEFDNTVALTTVMSNGFVTVEEGKLTNYRIHFSLVDIGRISFSRDLPVLDVIRKWSLLDQNHLEARLQMETKTHSLREHTTIIYERILP